MKKQQTLAIIKPKALKAGHTGPMITQIEKAAFTIKAIVSLQLTLEDAQAFYAIHAQRPFFNQLCTYMSSDPVIVMVLEKEHAIQDFRKLIGATNPADAAPHTLRHQFGISIDYNAIHGSDAQETATNEIRFFFAGKGTCCQGSCSC